MAAGKPRLGQHFLRSEAVLADIMRAADIQKGERVLEVGPGEGVLTKQLLKAVGPEGEVVAIEYDAQLYKALSLRAPANLTLLHADAMEVALDEIGPFDRIVSNLPYQISGPITAHFLDLHATQPWQRTVLLVQKEFGMRVVAGPGTKQYGRLSVHAARWCNVTKVRDVAPGCFDPPPDVDSVVIQLDPRTPLEVASEALWFAVVDGTFNQRRKQLRNTVPIAVKGLVARGPAMDALDSMGIASLRPEQVSPQQFASLVEALS